MKTILLLALVLLTATTQAKNYYISPTGSNSNNGLTPATAWQTVAKLNSSFSTIVAGDSILFKSGGTFYGSIILGKSGTSAKPIVISSYGIGAKPVITGFTTATGWTNIGGNLWRSSAITAANKPNMVTINGISTAMGRYPNSGYLKFESSVGNSSITDNELSATPNYSGGEVVIRKYHWSISRDSITSHSGSKISYKGDAAGYNSTNGFGYFVQNSLNTLDQQNEWYFNNITKVLTIYSTNAPNGVKVSTVAKVINTDKYSYITLKNLAIEGGNVAGIHVGNTAYAISYNKIIDCDISYSGREGIYESHSLNATINGCTISNSNNNGILFENEGGYSDNAVITNNKVKNSGMVAGMGYFGEAYSGITIYGNNAFIQYNRVDSSGYLGIAFFYNNAKVKNNKVDNFCSVKDDGGGIYTWTGGPTPVYTGREITDNVIINGIGAPAGTDDLHNSAHGIYLDDGSSNILIARNSIANMGHGGIYIHNSQNLNIRNNTFYNGSTTQILIVHDPYNPLIPIRNVGLYKNILVAKTATQNQLTIRTIRNDLDSMGRGDSNYYAFPTAPKFQTTKKVSGKDVGNTYNTVPSWKASTPSKEANSSGMNTSTTSRFEYNGTKEPITITLDARYIDVDSTVYTGSVTIEPYSSKVLIRYDKAGGNDLPFANAGVDKTITLPINTISLTGTGTDTDGTISNYTWTKVEGPSAGTIATPNAATTGVNNLVQGVYKFELTVKDNNGAIRKDTMQATVNMAENKFPIATAEANKTITLPTNTVSLIGKGTDTDGTISSYTWVKIAGPSAGTIATASAANTTVNNLVQGIYKFELTVKDNRNGIGKDTILVTVNMADNRMPIATGGTDKTITLPTNTVTLTGGGEDTDGTISSYTWVKIAGPSAGTIATANAANTTVNNLVQGIYKFELTIKDNRNGIGKDTILVTVNMADNRMPIATGGTDKTITLPTNTVTLTGGGEDTDGTISSYTWVKIAGPSAGTIATANAATTGVNNLVQGVYKFELTVKDNRNGIGKDTILVTVNEADNRMPIATGGTDKTITLPTNTVTLTGGGEDTDGTISSYTWVKIAGPSAGTIATANAANTTVNNLVQGIYKFELTVKDNRNGIGKDTILVTVNEADNRMPIATGGTDKTITLPTNTVTLTGGGEDTDGTISSYTWVKIAGPSAGTIATANAVNTTVNNLVQGIYKFELTVKDNRNGIGKDTIVVTVNKADNMPPVANTGIDQTITLPTNIVTITGAGTDIDGRINSYAWTKVSGPSSGTIAKTDVATTDVNNLKEGIYKFELTVTDNEGAIAKDTVQVTVNAAPNKAPVADAGTDKVITLLFNTTTLTGSGKDADGTISNYSWVQISGPSAATIETSNDSTTTVNNLEYGVYEFELTVTDNDGAISKDTVQVTVNVVPKVIDTMEVIISNPVPIVNAGNDVMINAPTNKATLIGTAIVTGSSISSYAWSKISGPLSGKIVIADSSIALVSKLVEGVYQFELTVKDSNGAIGKDTVQITVMGTVKHPPVAKAGNNTIITLPVNTTILSGNAIDADGTISDIAWTQIAGPSAAIIEMSKSVKTPVSSLVQGVYKFELTVTDNSGAIAKDTVQITVNAPVIEHQLLITNQLKVYPNPVRDIANLGIITSTDGKSKLSVTVVDMNGKLKYNESVNVSKSNVVKLDMSAFSDGYYIITVRFADGEKLSSKVIKYGGK